VSQNFWQTNFLFKFSHFPGFHCGILINATRKTRRNAGEMPRIGLKSCVFCGLDDLLCLRISERLKSEVECICAMIDSFDFLIFWSGCTRIGKIVCSFFCFSTFDRSKVKSRRNPMRSHVCKSHSCQLIFGPDHYPAILSDSTWFSVIFSFWLVCRSGQDNDQ